MIAKEFEAFLLEQEETFLTPAENLAALIDTHNADHAILVLSQITWSALWVSIKAARFSAGVRKVSSCSNKNASNSLAIIE